MVNGPTLSTDLIDIPVVAEAVIDNMRQNFAFTGIVSVEETVLEGGSKIVVPKYNSVGRATRLAETDVLQPQKLTMTSAEVAVREAGQAISFTNVALKTGFGDPLGAAVKQLSSAMSARIEFDLVEEALRTAADDAPLSATASGPLNWASLVSGFSKFSANGIRSLAGIVVNPTRYYELLNDADVMADARAAGYGATEAKDVSIAGVKVLMSEELNELDPTVSAVLLKKDALSLYWNSKPIVEMDKDIMARHIGLAITSLYAVNRTSNEGVVVLKSA